MFRTELSSRPERVLQAPRMSRVVVRGNVVAVYTGVAVSGCSVAKYKAQKVAGRARARGYAAGRRGAWWEGVAAVWWAVWRRPRRQRCDVTGCAA